jgi:hypothetical protein
MSTRNFDSSLLTKRRQAKALGAFASAIYVANNGSVLDPNPTGAIRTRKVTQPTTQMAIVVTEQNLGVCYCATDALNNPYPFNPSGGQCGCGLGAS